MAIVRRVQKGVHCINSPWLVAVITQLLWTIFLDVSGIMISIIQKVVGFAHSPGFLAVIAELVRTIFLDMSGIMISKIQKTVGFAHSPDFLTAMASHDDGFLDLRCWKNWSRRDEVLRY